MNIQNYRFFIIIVTYNAMKWIDKCISSVLTSTIRGNLVVVDNCSTDGTVEHIKQKYPDVMIFSNTQNLGFGKANNIGMQYALNNHCDYIYLLNQDAWVRSDTFEALIRISNENPEYGILSPIQITGSEQQLDQNFSRCCSHPSCKMLINDFLLKKKIKAVYDTDFVMAAHWLITKKCLNTVGGFNPSFSHYGEDDNYIHRAYWYGIKTGICPQIYGIHDREYRIPSKKNIIHTHYTGYLIILSNINLSLKEKIKYLLKNFIYGFKHIIEYHTFIPLIDFMFLFTKLRMIKQNNHKAKHEKNAFLELE